MTATDRNNQRPRWITYDNGSVHWPHGSLTIALYYSNSFNYFETIWTPPQSNVPNCTFTHTPFATYFQAHLGQHRAPTPPSLTIPPLLFQLFKATSVCPKRVVFSHTHPFLQCCITFLATAVPYPLALHSSTHQVASVPSKPIDAHAVGILISSDHK